MASTCRAHGVRPAGALYLRHCAANLRKTRGAVAVASLEKGDALRQGQVMAIVDTEGTPAVATRGRETLCKEETARIPAASQARPAPIGHSEIVRPLEHPSRWAC